MSSKVYDTVIIGFGPAGYTAGIYATRYNLSTLIVGEEQGGLVAETPMIENWPGDDKVNGIELMEKMKKQYLRLGGLIENAKIQGICKNEVFELKTTDDGIIKAKSVIVATGTRPRMLNVEGEEKFKGRGISYCATCDAPFFKGKKVAIIGGGDSAFTSALHLSQFVEKLYIIHRREEFRAQPAVVDKLRDKAGFILNKKPLRVEGKLKVESLVMEDTKTGKEESLEVDGIFVQVGHIPTTILASCLNIKLDKEGFIMVNDQMETNVKGIFSAGDCTDGMNKMRQIITAAAMGAIAAESAYKFITK